MESVKSDRQSGGTHAKSNDFSERYPLVSVVVTTYNQAPYLRETLQSVISQDYPNFEVIVVDDGSSDDTGVVASSFQKRILYFHQENQGVAGSRNTGVRLAKGRFLAFLDGDDLWEPSKLSAQVEAARLYPDAGIICCNGVVFSDRSVIRDHLIDPRLLGSSEAPVAGNFLEQLVLTNIISTVSQVMIPASVLAEIGESDRSIPRANDYDLYLRIARQRSFVFLPSRMTRWRYLSTSASGPMTLRGLSYLLEDVSVFHKFFRSLDPAERQKLSRVVRKRARSLASLLYSGRLTIGRRRTVSELFRLASPPFLHAKGILYLIAAVLPRQLGPLWATMSALYRRGYPAQH